MVTQITITRSTIGIKRMNDMIIGIIQRDGQIMIGMSTDGMIITIQAARTIDNMIIEKFGTRIVLHLGITVIKRIKEVVIRTNKIDQTIKNSISQKHRDKFSMTLREKTLNSTKIDVLSMNKVKLVVHSCLIAIFAGKMDIMRINV